MNEELNSTGPEDTPDIADQESRENETTTACDSGLDGNDETQATEKPAAQDDVGLVWEASQGKHARPKRRQSRGLSARKATGRSVASRTLPNNDDAAADRADVDSGNDDSEELAQLQTAAVREIERRIPDIGQTPAWERDETGDECVSGDDVGWTSDGSETPGDESMDVPVEGTGGRWGSQDVTAAQDDTSTAEAWTVGTVPALDGDDASGNADESYSGKHAKKGKSTSKAQTVATIIASMVYWPLAIVGIASPFMDGFDFGTLAPWQVIFTRIWLAVALLGFIYALIVNLGSIRDRGFFRKAKPLKIAVAVVADIVIAFGLIRIVCLI